MFKRFSKNKESKPTKVETWKKFELFDDLEKAEQILSKLNGGYSGNFTSVQEFHKEFIEELYDLKHQNVPDFSRICIWFAPTSA